MSAPQSIKDTILWRKADELVRRINLLSEEIPQSDLDIYQCNARLQECAALIPDYIEDGFKQSTKIDKIRSIIKTESSLDECTNYLRLVHRLKIGSTDEILDIISELKEMLNSSSSNRYGKLA